MIMKKIFSAMICAVVMLAPACTKDLTEGQNGGNVEMKTVTYSVSYEAPEAVAEDGTRIALGTDNNLVWEIGDAITVVYTPTGGEITSVTSEPLNENSLALDQPIQEAAQFTVEIPADATVHYAYSSKCAVDDWAANQLRPRLTVPEGSTSKAGNTYGASLELGQVIREGFATGAVDTANNTITLRNSTAFFEVQLTGTDKVWSVDVFSKSQNLRSLYGYVNNAASENPTLAIYQTIQPTSTNPSAMGGAHLNCNCDLSTGTTSFFFAMPVVDLPAGDLFLQIRTDDYTRLIRSKAAHSFKRNHVTRLKPIEVVPLDLDSHTYEPLDTEGRSNCYMVAPSNEDQYFSFPVLNINGDFEINDGTTKNYGVWPMWATKDGLIEDISVVYNGGRGQNGRVYFKVPAGTGNGSCMLTGGPINSTLIGTNWAWHIWITDAVDQTIGSDNTALTFLDRGPGALWTPKSTAEVERMTGETAAQTVGFMYQYGRHVPFPGPKSLCNLDGNDEWGYEACGSDGAGSKGRFKSNTPAVELYHFARWQHAFTVYDSKEKTIDGTKYYNMQFLQYNGTWATDMSQDKVSTLTGSENTWLTTEKGKQDPCPQGYRVATFKELIKIFRLPASDDVVDNTSNYCALNSYSTGLAGGTCQWRWTGSTSAAAFTDAFGGYVHHRDNATAKSALNDQFIWLPYGGMRLQYRDTPTNRNVASLYYAGMWDNNNDGKTIKTGYAFLWGTCDHYITDLDNASKIYMPSTSTSYFTTALTRLPSVFVGGSDNVWNVTANKTPMPASDAMPVRCVKLATAGGDAQVASLAAQHNDMNAWK